MSYMPKRWNTLKDIFCAVTVMFLLRVGSINAADPFNAVRCNAAIAKALTGKVMSGEGGSGFEDRHKDLGLRHLGATEISDRLALMDWSICGKEFITIEDENRVVRDVLQVPFHSPHFPQFNGLCKINGKEKKDFIFAILIKSDEDDLPAKAAWRVDEKSGKFIKLSLGGIRCPRIGIFTEDDDR
jgi:hypothetical protein